MASLGPWFWPKMDESGIFVVQSMGAHGTWSDGCFGQSIKKNEDLKRIHDSDPYICNTVDCDSYCATCRQGCEL